MGNEQKKYEYVLPVGTVLTSISGSDGKERRYTIEQVVNGKPLPKGQRIKSGDDVKPVLGQGGFGITYLASRQLEDGNIKFDAKVYYAIKEFFVKGQCWRDDGGTKMRYSPAAKKEVEESLRDFMVEAKRLNEICGGNPNIVNVNEVFKANGTAYYVMEYLDGGSLYSKVAKKGKPLAEEVAVSYLRPVAEAVDYLHGKYRLLHCDIKPDNIMFRVGKDGTEVPVLIDFGEAVHFTQKGNLTTRHFPGGSKGYAPQEQSVGIANILESRRKAREDGFVDIPLIPCEIDVYALGATLYFMLTGEAPYDAYSMSQHIIAKKLPQTVSEKTRDVVMAAMAPGPRERTQTVGAFLKGFEDRYTLPRGFVLNSPHAHYLITEVLEESGCYIRYGASLYAGVSKQYPGNTKRTQRYIVFEQFNKNGYTRQKDGSVSLKGRCHADKEGFFAVCKKHTGLTNLNESEIANSVVIRESFHANGTDYLVVKHERIPKPNILEKIKKTIAYLISEKNIFRNIAMFSIIVLAMWGLGKFVPLIVRDENRIANQDSVIVGDTLVNRNVSVLETHISSILRINKDVYNEQNKYAAYLDSLLLACSLNNQLKEMGVSTKNFDLQLSQKISIEYKNNLAAAKNQYLPESAKNACKKYISLIETKARGYYNTNKKNENENRNE